jgi:hypothetical protein
VQWLLGTVAMLSLLALIPPTRTFATVLLVLMLPVAGLRWFHTCRLTDGSAARAAFATMASLLMVIVGVALSPTPPVAGPATTATPAGTPAPAPASTPVDQPPAAFAPARRITAHLWREIAKNPAGHAGERIVIYGQVTQFDAATGTGSFRANVDGVAHQAESGFADYPTNTVLDGDAGMLADLVQGDTFKAEATVAGADTYQNTMGGSMTVPELTVTSITTTGSAN